MINLRTLLLLTALAVAVVPQPAEAYLDPGSGSMLLQVVLGGIAAAGVALRIVWTRVRDAFQKRGEGSSQG